MTFYLLAQSYLIRNSCVFLEQDGNAMFIQGETSALHESIYTGVLFICSTGYTKSYLHMYDTHNKEHYIEIKNEVCKTKINETCYGLVVSFVHLKQLAQILFANQ